MKEHDAHHLWGGYVGATTFGSYFIFSSPGWESPAIFETGRSEIVVGGAWFSERAVLKLFGAPG